MYSMQKRILQVVVSMQPAEFAFAYCIVKCSTFDEISKTNILFYNRGWFTYIEVGLYQLVCIKISVNITEVDLCADFTVFKKKSKQGLSIS